MKDVWIIGDTFLYDTFTTFQLAKTEAHIDKIKPSYIYDYYNVQFGFHPPLSQTRSIEARYVNSFTELLNGNSKDFRLPKYIIIILESDIIAESVKRNNDYGFKKVYRIGVEWVMNEFNRILDSRKEELRNKRPGALSTSAEPRLIWVTTMRRLFNIHEDVKTTFKMVKKANEVLEDLVKKFDKYSHIIYMDMMDEFKYFDIMGKLTNTGKSTYWRVIDSTIKKFNRNEIDLDVRGTNRDDSHERRHLSYNTHQPTHHRERQHNDFKDYRSKKGKRGNRQNNDWECRN